MHHNFLVTYVATRDYQALVDPPQYPVHDQQWMTVPKGRVFDWATVGFDDLAAAALQTLPRAVYIASVTRVDQHGDHHESNGQNPRCSAPQKLDR